MIDLAQLRKEDIGKWVLHDNGFTKEKGKIKSWNDHFIFVVYKCTGEWDNFMDYTGCATKPEELSYTTLEKVI